MKSAEEVEQVRSSGMCQPDLVGISRAGATDEGARLHYLLPNFTSARPQIFFMKIFFQKHKYHLIILALLIVIAGISADYAEREAPAVVQKNSGTIAVTLRLDEALDTRTELPAGSTVFTLMDTLQKNGQLSFRAKDYGGALGWFIEELNGVPNTRERNWIYYLNNQPAAVGVSNYTLRAGDVIEWKYEPTKF